MPWVCFLLSELNISAQKLGNKLSLSCAVGSCSALRKLKGELVFFAVTASSSVPLAHARRGWKVVCLHVKGGVSGKLYLLAVLLGLYFLFFATASAAFIFSDLNGVQSLCFIHSQLHLCAVIGWRKRTHSPRNIWTKQKHEHTGKGRGSAHTLTTIHV